MTPATTTSPPTSSGSFPRPFFLAGLAEPAGGVETGSGSFGGVCGSGPSAGAPWNGALRSFGTTGMPLVTVLPETLSGL